MWEMMLQRIRQKTENTSGTASSEKKPGTKLHGGRGRENSGRQHARGLLSLVPSSLGGGGAFHCSFLKFFAVASNFPMTSTYYFCNKNVYISQVFSPSFQEQGMKYGLVYVRTIISQLLRQERACLQEKPVNICTILFSFQGKR